jgi:hypothetical protein
VWWNGGFVVFFFFFVFVFGPFIFLLDTSKIKFGFFCFVLFFVQIENFIHSQIMPNWLLIPCFNVVQIVNLHYMLSKAVIKVKPTVLWCYKDKLELSRFVLPISFIFLFPWGVGDC